MLFFSSSTMHFLHLVFNLLIFYDEAIFSDHVSDKNIIKRKFLIWLYKSFLQNYKNSSSIKCQLVNLLIPIIKKQIKYKNLKILSLVIKKYWVWMESLHGLSESSPPFFLHALYSSIICWESTETNKFLITIAYGQHLLHYSLLFGQSFMQVLFLLIFTIW